MSDKTALAQAPSETAMAPPERADRPIRVVTATALFDGHDAAINVMRRTLQEHGAEVIHLGHNRAAQEIVQAAIQEDAAAVAVSSYQGGHMEFFQYMVDLLRGNAAPHIQVFGGGGGVIVPVEKAELEHYGVNRIYTPEDGRKLGIGGMIADLLERTRAAMPPRGAEALPQAPDPGSLARCLTAVEEVYRCHGTADASRFAFWKECPVAPVPVAGITGTGGAGKSSLCDELLSRFLNDFPNMRIGILSVDPTRRRTGGALLGDRIRMNAATHKNVFMRSLATRGGDAETGCALEACIHVMRAAGFDLILVETAGIGQGDAGIVPLVDLSLYVMTAEFGAASQLEKIEMIDLADVIVINKFDRAGSEDALRDVRKQVQRNRNAWDTPPDQLPVYGTVAARFNDDGVTALYHGLLECARAKRNTPWRSQSPRPETMHSTETSAPIPPDRVNYLGEIAGVVRRYHQKVEDQVEAARCIEHLEHSRALITDTSARKALGEALASRRAKLSPESAAQIAAFDPLREAYSGRTFTYTVRDNDVEVQLVQESLAGTSVPRVALPRHESAGEKLRWSLLENVPGRFPFTAGVFPFKRADEDPTRMFAGEGDAIRTNARFKFLSRNATAKRLSTAFDSVTLYGWDPEEQPDIYGKVGSSGVSICTLDDMKQLYDGFDLCDPATSVSMTINGPAPAILAMFLNTAIDQAIGRFEAENSRQATEQEKATLRANALRQVRGTVQADILKEDQGQNTCIFALDFALRMMGDVQAFFIEKEVRNFYSVSISGYHIAEAGANPIAQLAFTLANGFTYVEHYLSRGMNINAFAPNLSFFFSCGMDPEYSVLNRVARRIWAIALRDRYGADERSQKLKAHIQTSGRSLHAQEVAFNDIRTTLEALTAIYDHCNSLHTNAYDEAITTPTEESVRRALAIQLIINREFGPAYNENPMQGSYFIEELTRLVEEAVLDEFDRLSHRGGVLGAMERGYQRGRIQDDSLKYERQKASGAYPIVGVNTFVDTEADHDQAVEGMELRRGTEDERRRQLQRLAAFKRSNATEAPQALARLRQVCLHGGNIFEELMHTVRVCSLGEITHALFEVGGQYRRNT